MQGKGTVQHFGISDEYNDQPYAVAFVVHALCVLAVAVVGLLSGSFHVLKSAAEPQNVVALYRGQAHVASATSSAQLMILLAFVSLAIGLTFASIWLVLLQTHPEEVVTVAICMLPVLAGCSAVWAIVHGQWLNVFMSVFCCALLCVWVWFVWDRREFTGKLFKSVSTIYQKSSNIFAVAALATVMAAVWVCVLIVAMISAPPLWFVLLFSLFWTSQVLGNILFCSCGGVVARYYFIEHIETAVEDSTRQACTKFLGSICLGSLIMAVIQLLKAACTMMKDQAEEDGNTVGFILAAIADCILGCIESMAQIFNTYAFAFISIYGMPFWQAGQKVWELMEGSDAEALNNFSMVNAVSFCGSLAGGIFTLGLTTLLALRMELSSQFIVLAAIMSFLAGWAVMSVVSRIMEAGCTTLFVCYAEAPTCLVDADSALLHLFTEKKNFARSHGH